MKGTFKEILDYYGAHDLEFDAVIGDVDMPATYSFCGQLKISEYCQEKYGTLLNAPAEVKYDPTGRHTDTVIVDFDDDRLGERFTWAVAGYVSEEEYNKLFEEDE